MIPIQTNCYLTKERFVKCIDALKRQSDLDRINSEHIQAIYDSESISAIYPNDIIITALVDLLSDLLQDYSIDKYTGNWLEWWLYECDYGREFKLGSANYEDGTEIDLSTPEKLFDFLVSNKDADDSIEFGAGDKNKLQGYQIGQRLPTKYDIM